MASRRRGLVAVLVAAALVGLAGQGTAAVPPAAAAPAGWQGGPLHDGHTPGEDLSPPLAQAWSVELPRVSHAVVADGRAFVLSAQSEPDAAFAYGNELHALDAETGERLWGPVELGGTYYWAGHAYDAGRVFAVNGDGLLRARDASSGRHLWSVQLSQYAFSSPPTAAHGAVYVAGAGSGGTLYALDAATGELLWEQPVSNGDHSSPVVTQDSVYVSYACGVTHAFRRADGVRRWTRVTGCSGGGGKTAVLHDGLLYVRDHSYAAVLDAATGREVAPVTTTQAPAFHDGTGYFLDGGTLTARNLATGAVRWRQAGDGGLHSPPYVAGGHVYVGGSRGLSVFRESDGQQVWHSDIPVDPVDEHNVSQPYDGTTVLEGTVFVSGGDTLTALRPQTAPPDGPPSPTPSPSPWPLPVPLPPLPVPLPPLSPPPAS